MTIQRFRNIAQLTFTILACMANAAGATSADTSPAPSVPGRAPSLVDLSKTNADATDDESSEDDYPDWEDDEVAVARIEPVPPSGGDSIDFFTISLDDPASILLETFGTADTVGVLVDARGVELAADDDGGVGANFRIVLTLPAGRYVLGVSRAHGSTDPYWLRATSSRP